MHDTLRMLLTENTEHALRALLAETGIRPDPVNGGEIRWLFDGAGLRRRYMRASSPTIEEFTEIVWNRGITDRRPTIVEMIDLLSALQLGSGSRAPRHESLRTAVAREVAAAEESEHAIETRRKSRLRLYECEACRQKIRVASDQLTAFHRHEDPDTNAVQLAAFVLVTPTLNKSARGGAVPF